ncbi:Eco57I restriction-modification methylase domain-containing protein [Pseudofulvibacter geojedonensis]|uniref:site-specific DNA-methyltransferase (adenine-specific) n=1 Tax=Pseudofulvibacter geojedonensis TaxID=1123758 RepID=A0ABW3HYB0_9FLAO
MNKKELGSYYTPIRLAKFISDYCLSRLDSSEISILEPSVGDGVFVDAINDSKEIDNFDNISLNVVEREAGELKKVESKNIKSNISLTCINEDYLNFNSNNNDKYSLIIGNPPYIKSNLLTEVQKDLSREIHINHGLSSRKVNNIWTAFLISSISRLKDNGIVSFILPLELLQVKFTEEIRALLKDYFDRLEIFMFDELQFQECKGQDTVLLIGYVNHIQKGTFYTTISTMEDLESEKFNLQQNISVSESNKKWTHHFITPDEYSFLENLKNNLSLISNYVDNRAGIVTAANDYFIVNKEILDKFKLNEFSKPIVQKGYFVNGSASFDEGDFENLVNKNKPSYLLDFNSVGSNEMSRELKEYLAKGEELKIPFRFKCKKRKYWFQVPNLVEPTEAFFFKRAHEYPKFLKNEAGVYVTDSAYVVKTKENINIDDVIYSFYNSLTLAFSELEGRYYGGGVLELTPNEFRALPIPLVRSGNFDLYKETFGNKNSIKEILDNNNGHILNTSLGLNIEEISLLENIRMKLINKRHRKKS